MKANRPLKSIKDQAGMRNIYLHNLFILLQQKTAAIQ